MGVVNSARESLETCVLTTADSPQFNGVAERALSLIETAAIAGRIQAPMLSPSKQPPATACHWGKRPNGRV